MQAIWLKGFRPFFAGAALFSIVSMLFWLAIYLHGADARFERISPFQWHAHEMVFGYALAVIAGFLLTAAANWTGRETAQGFRLAVLFGLWAVARVLMLGSDALLSAAALFDGLFLLGLLIAVIHPILITRQLRQWPVVILLLLFLADQLLFYRSAITSNSEMVRFSIYAGFYLVMALVLFMGSRVIPFFTQRGVAYEFAPRNQRWADIGLFLSYVLFVLLELMQSGSMMAAVLAAGIACLLVLRVAAWFTVGVLNKPLLWSLHLSFLLIAVGFTLRALAPWFPALPLLSLHTFAVGGIGLITISMMTRVSLGHTGRNVHKVPGIAIVFLCSMILAFLFRVVFTGVSPQQYNWWIGLSGMAWVVSFGLFGAVFIPKLMQPRVDAAN